MKWLKWIVVLIALMIGVYAFIISDRDRSLWILNTAIKMVSSPEVTSDIAYGPASWQKLDLYSATDSTAAPVLVFVHGGGWYHGRKDQYLFAADAFVRLGYAVVLPDYVKHPSPQAQFPSHIEDIAKAVAWAKNNIAGYGGDPANIFIAGHSAGGHTVALLATDARYLKAQGLSTNDLRGAAPIAAPFSFIPDSRHEKAVFGPESNYPAMNPLKFVDGDEPPIFILHSDQDASIANKHPRELEATLKAAGQDVRTTIYEDYSHEDMVTHLHPWFAREGNVAEEIDRFFKAKLGPASTTR